MLYLAIIGDLLENEWRRYNRFYASQLLIISWPVGVVAR